MVGDTNHENGKVNLALLWAIIAIAICLAGLTIARMCLIPITHDEALSYQYVLGSYCDIVQCNPPSANNHILHTLLAKAFVSLFGDNLFALRLDNLLALIAYCLFGYLLLKKLLRHRWILPGFLALTMQPLLFDFWALSRGYGVAVALMMASIYCCVCYMQNRKLVYSYLALLWAMLAVYANFALLNYYAALCGGLLVNTLLQRGGLKQFLYRDLLAITLASVLLYCMIAAPINELRVKGELYFGGSSGFMSDTIRSVVKESISIDDINSIAVWSVSIAIVVTAVIMVGSWIMALIKRPKTESLRIGIILTSLLIIPVVATIAQHHLLGVLYLIERTAMFFIPLLMLAVLVWLHYFWGKQRIGYVLLLLLAGVITVNFICNMHLRSTHSWKYDTDNLAMLRYVVDKEKGRRSNIKLFPFWMLAPSLQYHTTHEYKGCFAPVERNGELPVITDTSFDYYYVRRHRDLANVSPRYIIDTTFVDGTMLLMRKQ